MSKTKKCVGKDSFLRMNYLYQLSNMSLQKNKMLSTNLYSSLIIGISKKAVQRIEPDIKRTICKSCHQYLQPGITCKVRIKKKVVNYTCNQCHLQKSFKANAEYKHWLEKEEAIVETLDYTDVTEKQL